jgi:hypothetical protein
MDFIFISLSFAGFVLILVIIYVIFDLFCATPDGDGGVHLEDEFDTQSEFSSFSMSFLQKPRRMTYSVGGDSCYSERSVGGYSQATTEAIMSPRSDSSAKDVFHFPSSSSTAAAITFKSSKIQNDTATATTKEAQSKRKFPRNGNHHEDVENVDAILPA